MANDWKSQIEQVDEELAKLPELAADFSAQLIDVEGRANEQKFDALVTRTKKSADEYARLLNEKVLLSEQLDAVRVQTEQLSSKRAGLMQQMRQELENEALGARGVFYNRIQELQEKASDAMIEATRAILELRQLCGDAQARLHEAGLDDSYAAEVRWNGIKRTLSARAVLLLGRVCRLNLNSVVSSDASYWIRRIEPTWGDRRPRETRVVSEPVPLSAENDSETARASVRP